MGTVANVFSIVFKGLRIAARDRRGRRLLFLGAVHGVRLANSDRARLAYAQAWRIMSDPRPRRVAASTARTAAERVKRRRSRKPHSLRRFGSVVVSKADAKTRTLRRR
jgi:hypothetical protein